MENWRQFQGTEIGSYLSKIYGNQVSIEYPKVATKRFEPKNRFQNFGSAERSSLERKALGTATERSQIVNIPSPQKRIVLPAIAAVDRIPKRKNEKAIRSELRQTKMQIEHYRPANTRDISSDEQKERLSQICTYKGGKGLPKDFILPVGKPPFEMIGPKLKGSKNETNRQSSQPEVQISHPLTVDEELAIQITEEITDRMDHLQEMKSKGILTKYEENAIENEIFLRTNELKKLQKNKNKR